MIGIAPRQWQWSDRLERFVTSHGLSFINLWDHSDVVWSQYDVPFVSAILIVNDDGSVRYGPNTFRADEIDTVLDWD